MEIVQDKKEQYGWTAEDKSWQDGNEHEWRWDKNIEYWDIIGWLRTGWVRYIRTVQVCIYRLGNDLQYETDVLSAMT